MNFCSDRLTLTLFYVEWLSVYLILLCETSTLKGNNWGEKLQKLQISASFITTGAQLGGRGEGGGGEASPALFWKSEKKCPDFVRNVLIVAIFEFPFKM